MSAERINHNGVTLELTRNDWFGTHGVKTVFPPDDDNLDPAIERKIDLYKLTPLLNEIKRRGVGATVVYMISQGDHFHTEPPMGVMRETILGGLARLREAYESGEFRRSSVERCDVMAVVSNEVGASGYNVAYPVPAFLEGVFGIDVRDEYVPRGEMVDMLLEEGISDRAILLPRVRCRKWWLDSDTHNILLTHLLPDEDQLEELQNHGLRGGLLSGEMGRVMFYRDNLGFRQIYGGDIDLLLLQGYRTIEYLQEISDEEIIKAGIPIIR